MINRPQNIIVLLAAIVTGAIAFAVSQRSAAAPGDALAQWLELDAGSVGALQQADPQFEADAERLRGQLASEREQLAQAMADSNSSDQQIRQQVESVIGAHNALERRVADHVLAVRSILSPEQQAQLMNLCADSVRRGGQYRWRRGWSDGGAESSGGRGFGGGGRGNGGQRGPGYGRDASE